MRVTMSDMTEQQIGSCKSVFTLFLCPTNPLGLRRGCAGTLRTRDIKDGHIFSVTVACLSVLVNRTEAFWHFICTFSRQTKRGKLAG